MLQFAIPAALAYLGYKAGNDSIDKQSDNFDKTAAEQAANREKAKQVRLKAINDYRAPEMSEQLTTRLKEIQDQATAPIDTSYYDNQIHEGPIATDARYQGQRAQVVQSAQTQGSAIQNRARAANVSGGYRNVGTMQDVYDRLGTQMAGIGQQEFKDNQVLKGQKQQYTASEKVRREDLKDRSTQAYQSFLDAQNDFLTTQAKARAAVEAGDYEAANQALGQALQMKNQAEQAKRQFVSGLISGGLQTFGSVGGSVLGGAFGGPAGAQAGGQAGGGMGKTIGQATTGPQMNYTPEGDTSEQPQYEGAGEQRSRVPYAQMRRQYTA